MASITITDNGNGTYSLTDSDRATLQSAILLTSNYKGGGQTVQYSSNIFDQATVYDIQAIVAQDQATISAEQTKLATDQEAEQATQQSNQLK